MMEQATMEHVIAERAGLSKHIKVLAHDTDITVGDAQCIRQTLLELIELAGMRALAEPSVYDVPLQLEKLGLEPFEDEGGITALACLSTSHVAIHTWPLRQTYHLDLYSCRYFDKAPVMAKLRHRLGGTLMVHDLTRFCD